MPQTRRTYLSTHVVPRCASQTRVISAGGAILLTSRTISIIHPVHIRASRACASLIIAYRAMLYLVAAGIASDVVFEVEAVCATNATCIIVDAFGAIWQFGMTVAHGLH